MAFRPNATSLRAELKNMALGMVGLSPSTATSSGVAARTSATVEFEVPKSSPQLATPTRDWSGWSCVSISKPFSKSKRSAFFCDVYTAATREVTLGTPASPRFQPAGERQDLRHQRLRAGTTQPRLSRRLPP